MALKLIFEVILFLLGDINDEQKHPNYSCRNVGTCSILKSFNILILPSETAESSLYAEKYNNLVQSDSSLWVPCLKSDHDMNFSECSL